MLNLGKIFLGLLFLVLMIEVIIIAPQNLNFTESDKPAQTNEEPGSQEANQVMQGLHLVEAKGEEKEWELWATEAYGFEQKAYWDLHEVKAKFFSRDGVTFNVTGNKGQVELNTKDMVVEGQVKVVTSNGYTFTTERVNYDSGQRQLKGPQLARMYGPPDERDERLVLQGNSMVANLSDSSLFLRGQVNGGQRLEDGRQLRIESLEAEFSAKSNYARFFSGVSMDVGSMRVSGEQATFDYSAKQGQLQLVRVEGGVRVSDRLKWATAREVLFYVREDKFVFRGNPRLVQENDQLVGDEIVFLEGGKKVQVLKARAKMEKDSLERVN